MSSLPPSETSLVGSQPPSGGEGEDHPASYYRGFFAAQQRRKIINREYSWGQLIFAGIFSALPIVGLYWMFTRRMTPQATAAAKASTKATQEKFSAFMDSMTPLGRKSYRVEVKDTKFKDVIGCPEALAEVQQYVDFLRKPERFMRLGGRLPRGCMLTGEPGTGKTMMAKAVAGEADVPFFACSGADFIEVYAGSGPKRVREIFEEARKVAPSVIFFDEIDAVGSRGGENKPGGMSGEENRTINQLLAELDGLQAEQRPIIVFAATNFLDNIDKAMLREGRFDRKVEVPMPDLVARKGLFQYYLKKIVTGDPAGAVPPTPPASTPGSAPIPTPGVDTAAATAAPPAVVGISSSTSNGDIAERLAGLTPGVSPATISTIVNEAALAAAVSGSLRVELSHLMAAIDDVIIGKKHRMRIPTDMMRRVALHEAGHTVVAWLMPHQRDVIKVSITPRGRAAGFTQQLGKEALDMQTDKAMFSDLCVLLGGRMAESTKHSDLTTGAQDDLQRATTNTLRQFLALGMSAKVGLIAYDYQRIGDSRLNQLCSVSMQAEAERESQRLLEAAAGFTAHLLKQHQEQLWKLTDELAEKRELVFEDIKAILGPRPTSTALPPLAEQALEGFIHGAETSQVSAAAAGGSIASASTAPDVVPQLRMA